MSTPLYNGCNDYDPAPSRGPWNVFIGISILFLLIVVIWFAVKMLFIIHAVSHPKKVATSILAQSTNVADRAMHLLEVGK